MSHSNLHNPKVTIYQGPPRSGKTTRLINYYIDLLNMGISTENILYMVSSSARKYKVIELLRHKLIKGVSQHNIYTFSGIVYNTLKDFWPIIEEKITMGSPIILPGLSGLEISEFLLRKIVLELNRSQEPDLNFLGFNGNLRSIVTQLLRRYNLKVDNMLTKQDLDRRAQHLQEEYYNACEKALHILEKKTLEYRTFDRARQISVFNALLKHPQIQEHFQHVQYLILDDLDEYTPAAFNFINVLKEEVQEIHGGYDQYGSTRMGYLSAYPYGIHGLEIAHSINLPSQSTFAPSAEILYQNILHNKRDSLKNIDEYSYTTRLEMLENCIRHINNLIKEGVEPKSIAVITPHVDASLLTCFQESLISLHHILTGTYRAIDNPVIASILTIVLLIKKNSWELTPTPYEIRQMLSYLLKQDQRVAEEISQLYDRNMRSLPENIDDLYPHNITSTYHQLLSFVSKNASSEEPLYNLFIKALKELFDQEDYTHDVINSLNNLLNSVKRFSEFGLRFRELTEKDLILQIKHGVVYDTPVYEEEIPENAVIIATPQKYIDQELVSEYQFWLDLKSTKWETRELAPLYNCWIHSKLFDHFNQEIDLENRLNQEKLARTLRAIMTQANKQISLYSSDLDDGGKQNLSRMIQYFIQDNIDHVHSNSHLLRQDQLPILTYTGGKMAVSAVPGSGKTFVNVELIINLITKGVDPESILVLTFMESASATLRTRLQKALPKLIKMPTICTIHSLAYSIITDSNNMVHLGYSGNLSVCDDILKSRIIKKIRRDLSLNPEIWSDQTIDKGISLAKSLKLTPEFIQKNIDEHQESSEYKAFPVIYKYYLDLLKHGEMIDFDDQINFALDLIRNTPFLREKYQQKYHYIIEDEAQDSSIMQQELMTILSERNGNVIRTGDLNQAITGSFTAADIEGFRKFINTAPLSIKMDQTQRCHNKVSELANNLMKIGLTDIALARAFLENYMQPIQDTNSSAHLKIFNNESEELKYISNHIKEILSEDAHSTIGVLLRNNSDVLKWTRYLTEAGFPCLCFTERFGQFKVFDVIKSSLKVIYKPLQNDHIMNLYKHFLELGRLEEFDADVQCLENLDQSFVNVNISRFESYEMTQLYYDVLYLLSLTNKPIIEIILNITHWLFDDGIDRSNGHLMAYIVKRQIEQFPEEFFGMDRVIQFFDEIDTKGINIFQQGDDDDTRRGFVQLMTIHKAKGQGFDYVFLPEFSDSTYGTNAKIMGLKRDDRLYIYLKSLKTLNSFLTEKENHTQVRAEETLRLIYVGITRAKKEIHVTCPLSVVTKFKKLKENKPADILTRLMDTLQA